MSSDHSSFDAYSSFELMFFGLVLVVAGGLAYAMLAPVLRALPGLLLVIGVMVFLQSSSGFRVLRDRRFVALFGVACGLVVAIDWWPLQFVFARVASSALSLLGVPSTTLLNPSFGGLQVLLFVPAAGTGALVGGEIDNACAGLSVLVPALLLLWLAKPARASSSDKPRISLFVLSVVVFGDLARIVVELWIPAVGLAPFELVHYPGAFLLGLAGLVAIALAGERWKTTALQ